MKKIMTLSFLVLITLIASSRSAYAFWPFDSTKPANTLSGVFNRGWHGLNTPNWAGQAETMKAHFQERVQALAAWLGWSESTVTSKLEEGVKPYQMAEEAGKDVAEWREMRQNEWREHKKEMGWTDEQIQSWQTKRDARWQNGQAGEPMGLGRGNRTF